MPGVNLLGRAVVSAVTSSCAAALIFGTREPVVPVANVGRARFHGGSQRWMSVASRIFEASVERVAMDHHSTFAPATRARFKSPFTRTLGLDAWPSLDNGTYV